MSPPTLSVNLNKVALLRNARDLDLPSVERAARTCLYAGADGITVHPRPDGRHIRPADVLALAGLLDGTDAEFNVEGNPFAEDDVHAAPDYPGFVTLVERAAEAGRLDQCTLVPDTPGQRTSDHGWRFPDDVERLTPVVERLHRLGCRVSLFVDAEADAMHAAAGTGTDRVELYTEPYAAAFEAGEPAAELARLVDTANAAHAAGLGINAGHDLNLDNLPPLADAVPRLAEVSIGHALTADALWLGLEAAVRAYKRALTDAA